MGQCWQWWWQWDFPIVIPLKVRQLYLALPWIVAIIICCNQVTPSIATMVVVWWWFGNNFPILIPLQVNNSALLCPGLLQLTKIPQPRITQMLPFLHALHHNISNGFCFVLTVEISRNILNQSMENQSSREEISEVNAN